jgi:hypothetical protein
MYVDNVLARWQVFDHVYGSSPATPGLTRVGFDIFFLFDN